MAAPTVCLSPPPRPRVMRAVQPACNDWPRREAHLPPPRVNAAIVITRKRKTCSFFISSRCQICSCASTENRAVHPAGTMRPRFILFGDSLTQFSFSAGGWGAALTDRYARKADVQLRGYSGYNTRWALFLLDKIFPAGSQDAPAVVTVFFGANDAALPDRSNKRQHVPVPEYKENLLKIISAIKSLKKETLVVLITPPPVYEQTLQVAASEWTGGHPNDPSPRTNEVTGHYAKACIEVATQAQVPVIDLWSTMQREPGWQTSYLSDGLHLTQEGGSFVFDHVLEILNKNGFSFEAMKWDFPEHDQVNAEDPAKTSW